MDWEKWENTKPAAPKIIPEGRYVFEVTKDAGLIQSNSGNDVKKLKIEVCKGTQKGFAITHCIVFNDSKYYNRKMRELINIGANEETISSQKGLKNSDFRGMKFIAKVKIVKEEGTNEYAGRWFDKSKIDRIECPYTGQDLSKQAENSKKPNSDDEALEVPF